MSDNQTNDLQIPHLKPTALLDIKVGTGFVERLQQVLQFLMEGKEQEMEALQAKTPGDDLTPFEASVVTMTMLLQEIMKVAKETDQIEYKSLSSMLPNSPDQH